MVSFSVVRVLVFSERRMAATANSSLAGDDCLVLGELLSAEGDGQNRGQGGIPRIRQTRMLSGPSR
jgi:hypothetical protein